MNHLCWVLFLLGLLFTSCSVEAKKSRKKKAAKVSSEVPKVASPQCAM